MKFIEFADRAGVKVLVNPAGVLFLREAEGNRTEVVFAGRAEPLVIDAKPGDVADALESAVPPLPPDPTLALVS